MSIDPSSTYVCLHVSGQAEPVPGGDAFWSRPEAELARYGQGWLISEFECASDWPNWEMHPHADEFVYLLAGSATLYFELPTGLQAIPLVGRGAVIVPQGIWHTAKVSEPSRMLFVTRGHETQHRPVTSVP